MKYPRFYRGFCLLCQLLFAYLIIKVLMPSDLVDLLCGETRFCNGDGLVLGEAVVDTFRGGKGDDIAYLVEVEIGTDGV